MLRKNGVIFVWNARDAVIGYDESGRLLFVVHIELEDEIIRVISARKATTTERNDYDSWCS